MNCTIEELRAQYKALGEQIAQKEKAEKEAKQKKLEAEKESRYQSIVLEMEKLATMIESWNADYGPFAVKGNVSPYLFHYFL
jgi:hypothetical protein